MTAPSTTPWAAALPGVAITSGTLQTAVGALLVLVVCIASIRMLLRRARLPTNARPRAWRIVALLALQALGAALLYLLLFPPAARGDAGTLVVLTRDASSVKQVARDPAARVIALPEAASSAGAERVPDLATALRRWPGTTQLQVIGAGLVARDRDAAVGLPLAFQPSPLPRGVVGLLPPPRVQAGRRFTIAVDVHALPGGSVELLDPAGAVVDRATLPASNDRTVALRLGDLARSPGIATWRLRLRDAARRDVQSVDVPMQIEPGSALRVLMLAGAPNAELKYLRRWATDGGLSLDARISLGGGLAIGDAPARIDDATLSRTDVLVLDQRSWQSLGEAQRGNVDRAVGAGMGLLLRLPEALSTQDAVRLRSMGFATTGANAPTDVRLAAPSIADRSPVDAPAVDSDAATASIDTADAGGPGQGDAPDAGAPSTTAAASLPTITRSPTRVSAVDGAPLLRDAAGAPLAVWRAQGRGRIGVASIGDTFRLVLAGRADAYDQLWSPQFETVARAARAPDLAIDRDARVDQRLSLCGISDAAGIESPSSTPTTTTPSMAVPLRIDPRTGARRCAAFWPRSPGWHRLRDGGRDQLFHVRTADDAPGIAAAVDRHATRALAGSSARVSATPPTPTAPGPSWPWLLGWLLVSGLLWWLERSRLGARLR